MSEFFCKLRRKPDMLARVPTSAEVTAQVMAFNFDFFPIAYNATVRTSAGVYRVFDGTVTASGKSVIVTSSGAVKVATGDIVTVTAA